MKRKPKNPITKIRTGTGDAGTTHLRNPGVYKDSGIVELVGDLDEASAALGSVEIDRSVISCETVDLQINMNNMLEKTRVALFQIGAMVHSEAAQNEHISLLEKYVDTVETSVSAVTRMSQDQSLMIPLEGFIIPNSSNASEMMARAIVRRAERSAVRAQCMWAVPALNVMSDLLFLIAWYNSKNTSQWCGFGS